MTKNTCSAVFNANGRKMNKGEFIEMALAVNGFGIRGYRKYSTAYYTASDIEVNGERFSVKSNQASLSDLLVTTKNNEVGKLAIVESYMATTNSTQFIYASHIEDTIVYYTMSREEFRQFMLDLWVLCAKSSKKSKSGQTEYKLRIRKADSIVIKYLEERIIK